MRKLAISGMFVWEFIRYAPSYLDQFPTPLLPVCLARAAPGTFWLPFNLYYSITLNTLPVFIYGAIVYSLIVEYRKAAKSNQSNNVADIKKRMSEKVTRALVFAAIWHVFTLLASAIVLAALDGLPYHGSLVGPYFAALAYNNGLAYFISNIVFVTNYRKMCLKLIRGEAKVNAVAQTTQ